MNKLSLAAASAALLVTSTAQAGPLVVHAPAAAARPPASLASMPMVSVSAKLPGLSTWIKYNTQEYPRDLQYWTTGSAYNVTSTGTDFAYDVNDPCGNRPCAPTQDPQGFVAAERKVVQSAPQRGQGAVQKTRTPPAPRTP